MIDKPKPATRKLTLRLTPHQRKQLTKWVIANKRADSRYQTYGVLAQPYISVANRRNGKIVFCIYSQSDADAVRTALKVLNLPSPREKGD